MPSTRDIKPKDGYLEKLNTLLPGEVTALYLFLRTLAQDDRDLDYYLFGFAGLLGVLLFFLAPQLLKVSDLWSRALYVFSFFLWVASIDISTLVLNANWPPLAFLLTGFTAIWTFALPYIFDAIKGRDS